MGGGKNRSSTPTRFAVISLQGLPDLDPTESLNDLNAHQMANVGTKLTRCKVLIFIWHLVFSRNPLTPLIFRVSSNRYFVLADIDTSDELKWLRPIAGSDSNVWCDNTAISPSIYEMMAH